MNTNAPEANEGAANLAAEFTTVSEDTVSTTPTTTADSSAVVTPPIAQWGTPVVASPGRKAPPLVASLKTKTKSLAGKIRIKVSTFGERAMVKLGAHRGAMFLVAVLIFALGVSLVSIMRLQSKLATSQIEIEQLQSAVSSYKETVQVAKREKNKAWALAKFEANKPWYKKLGSW